MLWAVLIQVCVTVAGCLLTVFAEFDLFLSQWHVCSFFPPSFSGAQAEGKCQCKHSCCLRGRSFSHLSPPRISQSEVTASSMPPPLLPLIPFPHPHSMSSLTFPPTASWCTLAHTHIHVHKCTPVPPFLQTDANRLLVLLVSVGVSFEMNLYTSAPELTSIGLNSFNNHDICLLAYLLSKQAEAQLASWRDSHSRICIR